MITQDVQEMYASAPEGTRASFAGDMQEALAYYQEFVGFVSKIAPAAAAGRKETHLLDVGCGCGWSSYAFTQAGYTTTGVDLNPAAFEPPATEGLELREGSATELPFADNRFDVVTSYQCLEHVPAPETALKEMLRVCKPGGIVCIVGPNLISPFLAIKFFVRAVVNREPLMRRTPTMPRHPYGNTVLETLLAIPINVGMLAGKLISPRPVFTMRVPDRVPPFHADNDACYLCNPVDLIKFCTRLHCRILQAGKHGRPPLTYLVAGGTWLAAQKPPKT